VTVTIANAGGGVVGQLDLGAMAAGNQTFSWNGQTAGGGTLPPGTYVYSVNAAVAPGTTVTATPYAVVPVTAVSLNGQSGPMLDLGGGLQPVAVSAVQQVF
jgi:flagellar basal-body rod modification protein FlgD